MVLVEGLWVVVHNWCLQEALRECRSSVFECWKWVLLLALWDYISVPRVIILHEVQCWCMVCSYSSYSSLVCVCTCLVTQPIIIKPVLDSPLSTSSHFSFIWPPFCFFRFLVLSWLCLYLWSSSFCVFFSLFCFFLYYEKTSIFIFFFFFLIFLFC